MMKLTIKREKRKKEIRERYVVDIIIRSPWNGLQGKSSMSYSRG